MKRKSGIWSVVVSVIGGSAKVLCLGSVLLTAACSTPTLPSDFPAFKLDELAGYGQVGRARSQLSLMQ